MTPSRRRGDPLTGDQLLLLDLLVDTDMPMRAISYRFWITESAAQRRAAALYAELGVADRAELRRLVLACELAPVGVR